jgi:DNA-directed RNA polymerase subunit RPC12/RpoP
MDKDFKAEFNQCPNCGSTRQFLNELGQELKDRNIARQEWRQHYDVRQGIVIDQNRAVLLPVGSILPGYYITTDICMDCGTLYATRLARIEGKTGIAQPKPGKPPEFPFGNTPIAG